MEKPKAALKRNVAIGDVVRTDSLPWLRRQFSTNTNYFKDIRVHRNSVMYRGAVLNLRKYRLKASSCPDIYTNSIITLAKENEQVLFVKYRRGFVKCTYIDGINIYIKYDIVRVYIYIFPNKARCPEIVQDALTSSRTYSG